MQLRLRPFVLAIMAGVLAASTAMAATVTLTMDLTGAPGTFSIFADASVGDNAGIASYGAVISGAPILTLDHASTKSLAASGPGGFGPAGFTSLRSADGVPTLLASQDTITPTPNLIFGFGQTANSFAGLGLTNFDPSPEQLAWDAHYLLATGTYEQGAGVPQIDPLAFDTFSNVFLAQGNAAVESADVVAQCMGSACPDSGAFEVFDAAAGQGYLPGALITGGPLPTNDDDDPDAGIAWLLESLVGPGGPVVGASVDPNTGVFSWQSQASSPLGAYTATIQGTNDNTPEGSDTGAFTFNLVPEPGTIALLGMGMVGLMGLGRRRDS